MTKWKKVTPLPPEFNGYGYLFECTKCHKVVTYLGAKKLPPWECKCQKKARDNMEAYLEDNRPTLDEVCKEYEDCIEECPAYEFCHSKAESELKGTPLEGMGRGCANSFGWLRNFLEGLFTS